MGYDLDKLRRQADEAEGRRLAGYRRKRAKAEAEKQKKQKAEARRTIDGIPKAINAALRGGNRWAEVMRIEQRHYRRPPTDDRWDYCDSDWLEGAAKEVWDHCVESGLKPQLEHFGAGLKTRFKLIVRF